MKFLSISVAIVCCIQFANANSKPTASQISGRSSVIFFKGTPGFADIFLSEEQQLQNVFNDLTAAGGPLGNSGKFNRVLMPLTTDIKNAITSTNTLKKDLNFLIKNIDTYATSQGTYNFPTFKVDEIVTNLQTIVSSLQNIQNGLTKVHGNYYVVCYSEGFNLPAKEGTQGTSGSISSAIITQINLIGTAATNIQSFIAFLTSAPTSGANTVMDLEEFMEESLTLLGALPNFVELIGLIIKNIKIVSF